MFVTSVELCVYTEGALRTPWAVGMTVTLDPLLCCLLLYFYPYNYGLFQPAQSARDAIKCS